MVLDPTYPLPIQFLAEQGWGRQRVDRTEYGVYVPPVTPTCSTEYMLVVLLTPRSTDSGASKLVCTKVARLIHLPPLDRPLSPDTLQQSSAAISRYRLEPATDSPLRAARFLGSSLRPCARMPLASGWPHPIPADLFILRMYAYVCTYVPTYTLQGGLPVWSCSVNTTMFGLARARYKYTLPFKKETSHSLNLR